MLSLGMLTLMYGCDVVLVVYTDLVWEHIPSLYLLNLRMLLSCFLFQPAINRYQHATRHGMVLGILVGAMQRHQKTYMLGIRWILWVGIRLSNPSLSSCLQRLDNDSCASTGMLGGMPEWRIYRINAILMAIFPE
jgi:hypothetical protein